MGPLSDFFMGCLIRCIVGQQVAQANWKKNPQGEVVGGGEGRRAKLNTFFRDENLSILL